MRIRVPLFGFALALAVGLATSAQAVVSLGDDGFFGVDTVIQDEDNNREFLRLDFTTAINYVDIQGEFGVGGQFEGWKVARLDQVEALMVAAGIVEGSTDPGSIAASIQLRDWFCPAATCTVVNFGAEFVHSLVRDHDPLDPARQLRFRFGIANVGLPNEQVDAQLTGSVSPTFPNEEIFLMRAPEPSTALLVLGGLVAIGRRRA